jgi:hypothetical protein
MDKVFRLSICASGMAQGTYLHYTGLRKSELRNRTLQDYKRNTPTPSTAVASVGILIIPLETYVPCLMVSDLSHQERDLRCTEHRRRGDLYTRVKYREFQHLGYDA